MTALNSTYPSLLDLASVTDPGGAIATVVEMLNQTNELLPYMPWENSNLETGHMHVIRSGIPTPTWRKMYGGVLPSKSTYVKVVDDCGNLEAYTEVDAGLIKLASDPGKFMMLESFGQIEGMNQEFSSTLCYGNTGSEPEAFTGLSPRYNSLSAENADNIVVGGGSDTDNASIWLMYLSPRTIFGIVPKNSVAGLQVQDLGEQTKENAGGVTGALMQVHRMHYKWQVGLAVKDWRAAVRIPNIDKSLLNAAGSGSSAVLPDLMFDALERVPASVSAGATPVFVMARPILTKVRQQLANKVANSTLTIEEVGGKKVVTFQGVPLLRMDALAADESLVS